jgi:cytosine/adenosine deaminase-related metal-dependent hydrolase
VNVQLENASVVHHDRIDAQPLTFSAGYVVASGTVPIRIDLRDHLIFPGLINAHDHLQLNAIPSLQHDSPFGNSYEWIDAFESHLKDPAVLAATRVPSETRHWHGALKNLLAGVTTVAHHDPWHAAFDDPQFPVSVLRNAGWSHSLGLGEPQGDRPPRYGPPVRESYCATPAEQPWIIHLAEGTDAIAASELGRLDALGCLSPNTVLVHGVGLTTADVDRIIECGAGVVWCPASNLAMLGRTLDVRRLSDAGRLTLGSDSRLTGSRDVLDELRVAAANSDLSSRELLRLVTADASRVLRLADRGALNVGQRADCVIVRRDGDPYESLLRTTRSSIRAVVRDGVPLLADPDFADWFALAGISTVSIRLDGQPKLMAASCARPDAIALEPGLELYA